MHLEALLQTGQLFADVRDRVRQAADLVRKSVHEVRELIRGLRPPILDELAVVPAIEFLIEETVAAGPAIETDDRRAVRPVGAASGDDDLSRRTGGGDQCQPA